MGIYIFVISLCAIVIQVHSEDDMILTFKEVSIPTKILIIGVFIWFLTLIFMNNFFKSPITFYSFLLFMDDIWILNGSVVLLGWILLENMIKQPIRFVKSINAKKYLIYSLRVVGIIATIIYFIMRFY